MAGQETELQEQQVGQTQHQPQQQQHHQHQQQQQQVNGETGGPTTTSKLSQLLWDVPMCVSLPIDILSPDQAFPFLDTTLAGLGIEE